MSPGCKIVSLMVNNGCYSKLCLKCLLTLWPWTSELVPVNLFLASVMCCVVQGNL